MTPLSEGLRVRLLRPYYTLFKSPFNRKPVRVCGVVDTLDEVPAGTEGTIYTFRTSKGLPHCGMAHREMWGVAFDGVPPTLSGHWGLATHTLEPDFARAERQQDEAVVKLREEWLKALGARRRKEEVLAGVHRKKDPLTPTPSHHWDDLKIFEYDCLAAQKAYDRAAGIPEREV